MGNHIHVEEGRSVRDLAETRSERVSPRSAGRRELRRFGGALIGVLLLGTFVGCRHYDHAPYPGDEVTGSLPENGPYRVVPGDRLKLYFQYHSDWDTEMLVRPDGMISVPFLGQMKVKGRSLSEIKPAIEEGLEEHIKDSAIRLDVEFAERMVYVGGEVTTPGTVTFTGPTIMLLEAIMKAGGPLKESADLSTVILARVDPDGTRHSWIVNLSPILTDRTPPQPVNLLNHDIVLIPNSPVDQGNIFVDKYINRMIPGGAGLWTAVFLTNN